MPPGCGSRVQDKVPVIRTHTHLIDMEKHPAAVSQSPRHDTLHLRSFPNPDRVVLVPKPNHCVSCSGPTCYVCVCVFSLRAAVHAFIH